MFWHVDNQTELGVMDVVTRLFGAKRVSLPWLFALLFVAALPYMLASTFYGLTSFDDEGTLMITFRDLKQGSRLYDETYALYGPFYYLTMGGLFSTLHLPLTHDMVRLVAVGFRVCCTLLSAGLGYLLTRSHIVAVIAFLLALFDLKYFSESPTHPEELCLLLMGLVPFLLHRIERGMPRIPVAIVGAIVTALLLIKINFGVFAAAALALTALRISGQKAWLRVAFAGVAIIGVLLPFALMLPLFRFSWAVNYSIFASVTIMSAILVWSRYQMTRLLTPIDWLIALSAAALFAMAIIGVVLLGGTTGYALINAILLQNAHYIQNHYLPTWFGIGGALGLLLGATTAIGFLWFESRPVTREIARHAASWLKFGVGISGIALLCVSNVIPDSGPPVILFRVFEPFCWLVIVPPAAKGLQMPVTRGGIGLLASFMVLYPFPFSGSQVNDAVLLLTLMLPVLVYDAVADLPAISAAARQVWSNPGQAAIAGCGLIAIGGLLVPTLYTVREYASGIAAGLPGARLIRLDAESAASRSWATRELSKCGAFYTMPGQLSYYFWTREPSPTRLNSNDPLGVLTDAQQEHVVRELSARPELCILKMPSLQRQFDRGQVALHPPLLRYIDGNFAPVASEGPYILLKRKVVPVASHSH